MEKLSINTAQNVNIDYQLASLGNRFLALAIDYAIMFAYGYLVIYILSKTISNIDDRFLIIGLFSFFLLPIMLYHFLLESFLGGQTVGKILVKTKVVRLDGSRASIYEYFIRWSLNIVDIWMLSGVIGLLSIVLSKQSQRLGDMAAGTTVISLKPRLALEQTVYENLADTYHPVFPEYGIRKLSDDDINIIKESFQKTSRQKDTKILAILSKKITEVTGINPEQYENEKFIEIVLQDHYYYHKNL